MLWIFLFIHNFFSFVISSNFDRYFNKISHEFKNQKKIITMETFNVDFYQKFSRFWIILIFQHSSYCRIYFLISLFRGEENLRIQNLLDSV